jgi:hypothetical protein
LLKEVCCWLVKLVKYLASFMNIFREEIFWYTSRSMSLGNHEPCTLGITVIAVFLFYGPQDGWTSFLQIIVKGAG